jgi:plasmid stabilization system protein ParE
MNSSELEIKWDKLAFIQLQKFIEFIEEDSIQTATKVKYEILKKVNSILEEPTAFGIDKYKLNNDGSHRYFEMHHLRIAFRKTKKEIKILRVRSTHQEPKFY